MKRVGKVGEDNATRQRKKRETVLALALGATKAIMEDPAPSYRKAEVRMLETLAGGLCTPSLANGVREVARKGRNYVKRVGEPKLEQIGKAGEDAEAEREMAERDAEEEQRALWAHEENRAEAAMDLVGRGVRRNRPEKATKGSTGQTGRNSKYAAQEEGEAARREYTRRYRDKKREGNGTSKTANASWALVAVGDDASVAN